MKISELMKKCVDEIVEMYNDCDLEELSEEQKRIFNDFDTPSISYDRNGIE